VKQRDALAKVRTLAKAHGFAVQGGCDNEALQCGYDAALRPAVKAALGLGCAYEDVTRAIFDGLESSGVLA
jgi:hypothetical protein